MLFEEGRIKKKMINHYNLIMVPIFKKFKNRSLNNEFKTSLDISVNQIVEIFLRSLKVIKELIEKNILFNLNKDKKILKLIFFFNLK
jgi:hypothetical protein